MHLILFLLFPSLSLGAIAIQGVAGVSGSSTDFLTIYGGVAGTCSTTSTTSTCNSCEGGTGFEVCNPKRIHSSLELTISFAIDSTEATGSAVKVLLLKSGDNSLVHGSDPTEIAVNVNYTFTVPWFKVCNAMGVTNCIGSGVTDAAGTFLFGVDKNADGTIEEVAKATLSVRLLGPTSSEATSTSCDSSAVSGHGLCYFQLEKGDEKVYVSDYVLSSDYPTIDGIGNGTFSAAYFYYAEDVTNDPSNDPTTLASITNNSSSVRIPMVQASTTSYKLQDNRLTGLSNGRRYCFIAVNEDVAGNLYRATDLATLNTGICASPEQVVGLLDDKKCFIATAAFGSAMDPHVKTLRVFRDRYLKSNKWGQKFVDSYYKFSPPVAKIIAESAVLKLVVRTFLWPAVFFAQMATEIGLLWAIGFLTLAGAVVFEWCRRIRRTCE